MFFFYSVVTHDIVGAGRHDTHRSSVSRGAITAIDWCAGFLLLLFLLTIPVQSTAQSTIRLKGAIYDRDDGRPVAEARIALSGTAYLAITDKNGRFYFEYLPEGWYTLTAAATGYDSSVIADVRVVADVTSYQVISLVPRIQFLPGVVVRGERLRPASEDVTIIDRRQIEAENPTDLADLLETVAGLHIQRTGGATGPARVSIRGSLPRQVLILLDGQRINSASTGEADINSIPVEMVDHVVIHKGGSSAEFGPNAAGGVVNIVTQPARPLSERSLETKQSGGKWGTRIITLSAVNPLPLRDLFTTCGYGSYDTDGDFPFSYTVQPANRQYEGFRENNSVGSDNFHFTGQYQANVRNVLKLSGQVYSSKRGLPDRASRQNERAEAEDSRVLLNTSWEKRISDRCEGELYLGFSRFKQRFIDTTNASVSSRFNSEYFNDVVTARLNCKMYPWGGQTVGVGVQVQNDGLDHEDKLVPTISMGHTSRTNFGLYASALQQLTLPEWIPFELLTIDGSLRYDKVKTSKDSTSFQDYARSSTMDFWSPRLGFSLKVNKGVSLVLRGSYGKSLNLPTLNALFWKGDARSAGNPSLKPEEAEHSDVGVEMKVDQKWLSVVSSLTYFHTFYTDLVMWRPDFRGIWRPFNLAAARITGHEDMVAVGLFDRTIELTYQNTILTARNRLSGQNSYNKQLTFTPHYQTSLTTRLSFRGLFATYAIRWVDRRYALENNKKWYDAYRIDDLTAGGRTHLGRFQLQIVYRALNLRDIDYTLIAHYPMPPREWQISVSLTYSFQNKAGE